MSLIYSRCEQSKVFRGCIATNCEQGHPRLAKHCLSAQVLPPHKRRKASIGGPFLSSFSMETAIANQGGPYRNSFDIHSIASQIWTKPVFHCNENCEPLSSLPLAKSERLRPSQPMRSKIWTSLRFGWNQTFDQFWRLLLVKTKLWRNQTWTSLPFLNLGLPRTATVKIIALNKTTFYRSASFLSILCW